MPSTALIFLPAPIGNPSTLVTGTNAASPAATLITHISRTYSLKSLGGYLLDHRLLVDTSSLLPGHKAPSKYTHFLTLPAHFPGKTFIGTSASNSAAHSNGTSNGTAAEPKGSAGEFTLVTIPSHTDTLFPLLMQRMSPLWVPRQAHRLEGGASFEVADFKVRIGELRISGGRGQGGVRGCLCEIEFLGGDDGKNGDDEDIEELSRAFFQSLVRGSDVDAGTVKVIGPVAGEGSRLVRQYMELLKFART
jgi:TATA-binding related factor (TRF) of subunit 20 of Mediator complex